MKKPGDVLTGRRSPTSSSSTSSSSDSFGAALAALRGCFLQLTLKGPISRLPGGSLPIVRLLEVAPDYVVADHVIVDGTRVPLLGTVLIKHETVQAAACVHVKEMVVDLALALRPDGVT